ncbi:hypothetical protein PHYBLDRAFT_60085 [Phycomyces blakesleeanus NRRL 1555(-)]|uniref:Uncharacterized protein n=1 Tax=Phycomyces blakesleeanus (strain ATCC 8743b / DSM 1359 / FGSC 10004 / NBRC 33097 / NRRL 1555) TaxID=763407 RepID=A0A162NJ98_PHYB8|nr:hypothetical protein PHYBLDRAFT_60085 [Phycomyces blakesleeanus NRRL 1555(-)]OAD70184.1 hypothetical protein PHYBLDRAFT_60085 [Phycomyces blakesleeanus NRRL 1555(-)]|eukprot:XP_018288224.1 hypothetical protein PHYBLDRAFT_60085 [Phycomyces blakesleeanus NRRL 1555(-)]
MWQSLDQLQTLSSYYARATQHSFQTSYLGHTSEFVIEKSPNQLTGSSKRFETRGSTSCKSVDGAKRACYPRPLQGVSTLLELRKETLEYFDDIGEQRLLKEKRKDEDTLLKRREFIVCHANIIKGGQ